MKRTKRNNRILAILLTLLLFACSAPASVESPATPDPEAALSEAYAAAQAAEAAGSDEQALAQFLSLGDYRDAADRAVAIRARLDFAAAQAVFTGSNYDEGIAALLALGTDEANAAANALAAQKEAWMQERRTAWTAASKQQIAAGAWHTAAAGDVPWIAGDARYSDAPTDADAVFSGLSSVLYLKDGRVITTGETFGDADAIAALQDVQKAAPGLTHALFLNGDGTVTAVGSKAFGRLDVADWTEIVDIAAGAWHSVGVMSNGTVKACGDNHMGQCDVADWAGVTAVAAGLWHTAGLRSDGTVVACGDNTYGQCDVADWTDISELVCGACTTVGLKADGTVVACGDNAAGQCDVAGWTDVGSVAAGAYHTVGLRLDGTVVSTGRLPEALPEEPVFASDWISEPIASEPKADAVRTAYIEGAGDELGPWLYLDPNGAVLICIDDSEEKTPFRADMLATANALPFGSVTDPNAQGRVIRMPTEMPADQAVKNHAVLAFTGDYIGYTSNRKGVMMRNGTVFYDRDETTTLALLPDGTMRIFETEEAVTAQELTELGVRDSFSFGPVLVKDGVCPLTYSKDAVITMRVAFGSTDPFHYLAAVTLRDRQLQMSHFEIGEVCARYGCKTAYNLDGGHSTSLVFLGQELSMLTLSGVKHSNIRALSDIIVFLTNDSVQ